MLPFIRAYIQHSSVVFVEFVILRRLRKQIHHYTNIFPISVFLWIWSYVYLYKIHIIELCLKWFISIDFFLEWWLKYQDARTKYKNNTIRKHHFQIREKHFSLNVSNFKLYAQYVSTVSWVSHANTHKVYVQFKWWWRCFLAFICKMNSFME